MHVVWQWCLGLVGEMGSRASLEQQVLIPAVVVVDGLWRLCLFHLAHPNRGRALMC